MLETLVLISLVEGNKIYGMVIIYQLWYHDENIEMKRKSKYKKLRKKKVYKRNIINKRLKYIKFKDAVAYNTYDSGLEHKHRFDTNSFSIGVDNICSGYISHKVEAFVWPLKACHRFIKRFGGKKTMNFNMGKSNGHGWTTQDLLIRPEYQIEMLSHQQEFVY